MTIFLYDSFYSSLDGKCDLVSIIEKCRIKDLIPINNKLYCLSGSVGTGTGFGCKEWEAYEAIRLDHYKKEKKPLRYVQHFAEVDQGNRQRSYDGLLLDFKNKKYVLVGPKIEILPIGPHPVYKIPKLKLKQEAIVKHSDLMKPFIARKDFDKWLEKVKRLNIRYSYRPNDAEGKFVNEWTFKKL